MPTPQSKAQQPEENPYLKMMQEEEPSSPEAAPGASTAAAQPQSEGMLPYIKDIGVGAVKGLTGSLTAAPEMIGKIINEAAGWKTPQRVHDQDAYLEPINAPQKIGKYGEQAAELLSPIAAGANTLRKGAGASKLFDEVMTAAKGQPVNLTRTQAPLERIAQLTDAGGPTLTAPNKLMLRSQQINPIPYEEARDFYTNISNLSKQDKQIANRPMLREVGNLRSAFNKDIGETANSVGKGEQYNQAMQDYARAARLKDLVSTGAKWAIPTAIGGGTYGLLRDLLSR